MSAVTYRMIGADEPNSVMDVEPHPLPQVSEPVTIIKCAFAMAEEPPGFRYVHAPRRDEEGSQHSEGAEEHASRSPH